MILLPLFVANSAHAAVDDTLEMLEDAAENPFPEDPVRLRDRRIPPIRLQLDEDVTWSDFQGTDVTTIRTKLNARVILPLSKTFIMSASTYGAVTNTLFGGRGNVIDTGRTSGDAWDELYEFSLRLQARYLLTERWGLLFASWMTSRFEQGASFRSGMKGAGALAMTYNFGDRVSVSAGLAVSSRIVGAGTSVNPIVIASWQINDVHELATSGLGVRLKSNWNKTLTTFVYGRFKGRRWRLDDREDGIVNKGTLRDRQAPIGVGIRWKFLKRWSLRGDFGLLVYRQLKTTNEDDDSINTRTSSGPGVFGGLLLAWRY